MVVPQRGTRFVLQAGAAVVVRTLGFALWGAEEPLPVPGAALGNGRAHQRCHRELGVVSQGAEESIEGWRSRVVGWANKTYIARREEEIGKA